MMTTPTIGGGSVLPHAHPKTTTATTGTTAVHERTGERVLGGRLIQSPRRRRLTSSASEREFALLRRYGDGAQLFGRDATRSFAAMVTRSGRDSAFIFRIT